MSRRGIILTLASLLVFSAFPVAGQKKPETPKQTKEQQKSKQAEEEGKYLKSWLDEDVAYIITDEERAAFKSLKTDEERYSFMESFWLRRDPTPDSVENEFKDDHYARIAKANERYASGTPGWKTDRGRIYILYGEPDSTEGQPTGGTYHRDYKEGGGVTATFPWETWRYRYIEGQGTEVTFEFVDPSFSGEYHLTLDPSEKDALLHVPGAGLTDAEAENGLDKSNRCSAGSETSRDDAHLGASCLSLGVQGKSQFDRLDAYTKAFRPPEIKFKDLEAIIDTRLSYNLLPFNFRTDFAKVTEDQVLIPVTIQIPWKGLAFKEQEGVQVSSVHVQGRVTPVSGRPGPVFEQDIETTAPTALYKDQVAWKSAIYQKVMTLPPGLYKLSLVVKDMNSNNVGTIQQSFSVPRYQEDTLGVSSLILADVIEPLPPRKISDQFSLGNLKVRPVVQNEFQRDADNLNVWLQVYGLKIDETTHKADVSVEMLITKNGKEVKKITEDASELSNAAQQMTITKKIPLTDLDPGAYAIQVRVTDNLGKKLIPASGKFTVR